MDAEFVVSYSILEPLRLCQIKVHHLLPRSGWGEKPEAASLPFLRVNSGLSPATELPLEIKVVQQNSLKSSFGSKGKLGFPGSPRS